jgi:hypothetical protein
VLVFVGVILGESGDGFGQKNKDNFGLVLVGVGTVLKKT